MFIELHALSAFSFLEAASLPETLVERAAALGYSALALVDRDEPARATVEFLEPQRALPFRRAQFHAREQAAEVLVPLAALDKDRQAPRPGFGTRGSGLGIRDSGFGVRR